MANAPLPSASAPRSVLFAFGFFLAEFLLFTALRNIGGPHLSPVLFYLSSVCFTGAAFFCLRSVRPELPAGRPLSAGQPGGALFWLGAVAVALLVFYPKLKALFEAMPVDPLASDIVPSLQIYVGRFLEGKPVYAPITDFAYPLYPTYLPAMWMPFLLPDWLGKDYRWLGMGVLGLGVLSYAWLLVRQRPPFFELLLKLALPFIVLQAIIDTEPAMFGYTVETMIIGYYLLLCASLFSSSVVWRAAGLLLCLLSRFSLVLWVPLWLLLIWQQEGRRPALRLAGLVAVGILLLYVVPFLSKDWHAFAQGQSAYAAAAVGEWQHLSATTGKPEHLYNGIGFALYFLEHAPGELLQRVQWARVVHAGMSAAVVAAATAFWFVVRPRLDYRLYALLVLKLYLATFYAFIQVPYAYLTSLVLFMSLPLLLWIRPGPQAPIPREAEPAG